jgi:hypothetical protein
VLAGLSPAETLMGSLPAPVGLAAVDALGLSHKDNRLRYRSSMEVVSDLSVPSSKAAVSRRPMTALLTPRGEAVVRNSLFRKENVA